MESRIDNSANNTNSMTRTHQDVESSLFSAQGYVDLEADTKLRDSISKQLESLSLPNKWNEFFYQTVGKEMSPFNKYVAVIDLFKDYCGYKENEEDENKAYSTVTWHTHNPVVARALRITLKGSNKLKICLNSPLDTDAYLDEFFKTLEDKLRYDNQFLNPAGSLVKRIAFAQRELGNEYINLKQLCFDLSEEKTSKKIVVEEKKTEEKTLKIIAEEKTVEKPAVEEKSVEVVESVEGLAARLRPGIVEQLRKLTQPLAWMKFFYDTGYEVSKGKKIPYSSAVNPYEAVINLFKDYCVNLEDESWGAIASNFFKSQQHNHNEVVSNVVRNTLASYSIETCRGHENIAAALREFFISLATELRNKNQYLSPNGSLMKRINFALKQHPVLEKYEAPADFMSSLCIDLSNEVINLQKTQASVQKPAGEGEIHMNENEDTPSFSFRM
jgi:hypothetical protein